MTAKPAVKRSANFAKAALAALILAAAGAAFWQTPAISAEDAVVIPPPALDEKAGSGTEKAIFAGGCFWGVQGVFQHVKGVTRAVSGYTGGTKDTAVYEMVGTSRTGHAESVEITYEPSKVTYGQLLQVYFSVAHNPTQLNYQGPDSGTQYRSTIFAENDAQKKIAAELHRPARQGEGVCQTDRDDAGDRQDLLSGRGLSPGLPDAEPDRSLHRLQ